MRRLLVALLLPCLVLMSACSLVPTRLAAPATARPERVTLRLWADRSGSDVDQVIAAFEARNPGINVTRVESWESSGRGAQVTAQTRLDFWGLLESGTVDIVATGPVDVRAAVDCALLKPLDPFVEAAKFDLSAYGTLIGDARWNGRLYELPVTAFPYVILINQSHFDRAGLIAPHPSWTWNDFRSIVTTLSTRAPGGDWAFAEAAATPATLPIAMAQDLAEGGAIGPTSARSALEYWAGLPSGGRGGGEARWREFISGRGAMLLVPLDGQRLSDLSAVPFQWGVLPLPEATGGPGPVHLDRVGTYAIAARSAHADEAWRFLQFAGGPIAAGIWAKAATMPARRTDAARQTWRDRLPASAGREWLLEREWSLMFTRSRGDLPERSRNALFGALADLAPDRDPLAALSPFLASYEKLLLATK